MTKKQVASKKTTPKTKKPSTQVENFEPNKVALAVSTVAVVSLVLLGFIATTS